MTQKTSQNADLPQRRSPRIRGFNYPPTLAYSITICTRHRIPFLADQEVGRIVVECLKDHAQRCRYRLIAYCIMPDHIHILTGPSSDERAIPLPRFIRQFKAAVTYSLATLSLGGSIWQRSFYDHVLRKDEDLAEVARYILDNPVRKGLVDAPEQYPLSRCFLDEWPA